MTDRECLHPNETVVGKLVRERQRYCPDCGNAEMVDARPRCMACGQVCYSGLSVFKNDRLIGVVHTLRKHERRACAFYLSSLTGISIMHKDGIPSPTKAWSPYGPTPGALPLSAVGLVVA